MSGEQGRPDPGQQPDRVPPASVSRRLVVGPTSPRLAALDGLLRDLDGLRRTVETDLTLAAAAVDAGEPALAGALVQGDRDALLAFEARALEHLQSLERADAEEAAAPSPVVAPHVVPLVARRRRRPLRIARFLPAAPLVAAAAALVGLLGIPQTAVRPPAQVPGTVLSSWEELTRLSAEDAPADEVHRAAMDLNADIASMVARAGDDPEAARQALALLAEAQAVLTADDDAPALAAALGQARALAARLLASLPPTPGVSRPPVPEVEVPALPTPRAEQRPRQQRAQSPQSPQASPSSSRRRPRVQPAPQRPRPAQRPGTAADAEPNGTPSATPSASPSPSRPAGRPTPTPPPVLPGPISDPL